MEIGTVTSQTLLFIAARGNFYEILKLLVENSADVNAQDPFGWTSLHYAIYHENMNMVQTLVCEDTNFEWKSFEFGTPQHHALFDGEHKIFELLISFGANVNSLNLERFSSPFLC